MAPAAPSLLYLTFEALPGAATLERLKAALSAARASSVLLRAAPGSLLDAPTARPFVELIQSFDAAALILDDAALVRTLRADGVHLSAGAQMEDRFTEAREILGTRYIIGGEAGASRHEAMSLGELGADYVAFTGPDVLDLAAWWAEIFEVPCVAFCAATADEAAAFAATGTDFVGLALPMTLSPADIQAHVRACASAMAAARQSAIGAAR